MADEAKTSGACDVAVIGGGVIGLSCAWRLAQRGAKVSLFERGQIGREASWAAAGMLAAQVEAAHHPLHDSPSPARSAMLDFCLKSRALYPSFADELFEATGIDIELSLRGHARGDWRTPGIMSVKDGVETWFAEDGQVENRYLVRALREAARRAGVALHQGSKVKAFRVWHDRVLSLETATSSTLIECDKVLLCAGTWSALQNRDQHKQNHHGLPPECLPPVRPVAGEMLCLRTGNALRSVVNNEWVYQVPHVIYGDKVYLVPRRYGRVLVGATMEERGFDKRVTARGLRTLLDAACELVPALNDCAVEAHWAGLRPATPDGLPILGRTPLENLFVATGHFRNGILLTPITAQLMADCILEGQDAPQAFALERFHP